MSNPDLQTILEDVKTIKSILLNTDAPLPPVWRLLYFVAVPALVLIAILKISVPALSVLSFLDTALWLWLPVMGVAAVVILIQVSRDLKTTGTRFLAQSRVRVFLYTRMILAPSILTLGYLLSLNPAYSMDGAMMILVAVGLTQVLVMMPDQFRALPLGYLLAGFTELGLGLQGPWWTLVNTLAVAGGLGWTGTLLQRGERLASEDRHG